MDLQVNVLLCIAAPLLVMFFIVAEKNVRRVLLFFIAGMFASFAAVYVDSFAAQLFGLTHIETALQAAPVLEECLKAIPLLVFFFVFKPDFKGLLSAAIACGAGFAMHESVMYLISGMSNPVDILLRGFSTGVMHAMTVALFAAFLWYVTQKGVYHSWVIWFMCGIGVLASGVTLHGCYNLLVNSGGAALFVGYAVPVLIAAVYGLGLFIREKKRA